MGAILGVALGVAVSPWLHLVAAAALVLAVWEAWLIPRQVRAMGYALAPDHLLWRKGIMFRSISVIPYGRMQFVDTSQGPLARALGIAEVKLHTAAATTDATINGLPVGEAERLRQIPVPLGPYPDCRGGVCWNFSYRSVPSGPWPPHSTRVKPLRTKGVSS